ncbi:MAG: hypothetical protein ABI151_14675 [Chitinophagaceae bacterium]
MKSIFYFLSSAIIFFIASDAKAQETAWPKTVALSGNNQLKVYEPQPESYSGNLLKIRSAISYLESGKSEPVFGVLWADVTTASNNQYVNWQSVSVTNLKLPADNASNTLDDIENQIRDQAANWNVSMTRSALDAKLKQASSEAGQAQKLSTAPPSIIYTNKPSTLVFVDGEPQIQQNQEWGVNQVVNTPFTILKNSDQQFYLYGNKRWYRASDIRGPWNVVSSLPSSLSKAQQAIRQSDTSAASGNSISKIIVSQVPAELVQSDGEANFAPLQGTNLLYMTNSSNDVFMDVNSQHYFVLLSGRWYTAPTLSSTWNYTAADKLPADFARIPESSIKANVLSSVAGTDAAFESVAEAQVPQTAKVDRKKATATVTYDGDPRFENIEGTDLKYGVNSSGEVLQSGLMYYYVENGVWFQSQYANGPWAVATQRPSGIENIPPGYPVYNLKYVHIYDVYPDYVYMGYTPGYLGNYVYGPTIVYGTGYYYKPWRGRYYYARPTTWGFNMRYNPWNGWSFGYNTWPGWFFSFNVGYGHAYRNYPVSGGWWGPSVYRPPYYRTYPSYYGRTMGYDSYRYPAYGYNNVYRSRRDVVTTDRLYRSSVFDRRNDNRRGSYNYDRPRNNNGRNPSQPRPSGGYTNGRTGNDRIDNNTGSRLPDNNGNNLGNRQPNPGGNNGSNRQPRYNNSNNSQGNRQPGNVPDRQPRYDNSNNSQGNRQPGSVPDRQPRYDNSNNSQGNRQPGNVPDRQPSQGNNQPNRTPATIGRPPRTPERQETPQQSQPTPERRPQQQLPNRQAPQAPPVQRPERKYTPSNSNRESQVNEGGGRQESGNESGGRERNRRGG